MEKQYPDDDGRVIADMEDLESLSVGSGLFTFRTTDENARREKRRMREQRAQRAQSARTHGMMPGMPDPSEMSREDRKAYIFGAMKAVLMIGSAYVVGFGALILLLFLIWGLF